MGPEKRRPVGAREQAQAARTGGSQTPGAVGVELSMMAMAITQCMIYVGPVVLVVIVHNNKDIASGLHDSSPNRYASTKSYMLAEHTNCR